MFCVKPTPKDGVQRPNGFRFGVAEEELFDCIILCESKLTITDTAFGQVVRYLQSSGFKRLEALFSLIGARFG
ncbi:unnamed protein product [Peronospora belbahrii]|uniref:Uncharacterized protein n=1 Tax=Peronospora belbahrii TaxID=622444 RepID=A0AAU9L6K0_9STRA|nr:unnamed protein product [Peronospora belbahrii]